MVEFFVFILLFIIGLIGSLFRWRNVNRCISSDFPEVSNLKFEEAKLLELRASYIGIWGCLITIIILTIIFLSDFSGKAIPFFLVVFLFALVSIIYNNEARKLSKLLGINWRKKTIIK